MCGIVGAIAERNVTPILLAGLRRLEYRGYDSAGVAVLGDRGIARHRYQGKVQALADALGAAPDVQGHLGIAHTRWATHGPPSEANAHPHMSGNGIALVHNGIIENFQSLRDELSRAGYRFSSDTDTEVIVHLLHQALDTHDDLAAALRHAVARLDGAYAVAVISDREPNRLVAIRHGSPLVVGLGIGENFIASDQLALLPVTNRFIFLEDGDIADLRLDSVTVTDAAGATVSRKTHEFDGAQEDAEKGEYRHYMLKEIFEQPAALQRTLEGRIDNLDAVTGAFGDDAAALFARVANIHIVACGTSFHAGMVARYWIEALAGIPCQVEVASEYRYRRHAIAADTLLVTISQSGETADSLAALRAATSENYLAKLSICNVEGSSLYRESDFTLLTRAGPEIGVASTKAFTTQLVGLLLLTVALARGRGVEQRQLDALLGALRTLPGKVEQTLGLDRDILAMAEHFAERHHTLFLGRGSHYPIAMEGALKLKEISYIHAEAYPAGELKHGPLALVDKEMPVVAVAPNNELLGKLRSNLQEVSARGGELYVFADRETGIHDEPGMHTLALPPIDELLAPILYTIPLQLLSYHVAVMRGTDVDQPRNLAKSVTVE